MKAQGLGQIFRNPVTQKLQKAPNGVKMYGFDTTGNVVYAVAVDFSGVTHFMGKVFDAKYFVEFE